jgi:hypothetical protein
MKTRIALALLIALTTIYSQRASAQQTKPPDELKKVEVGVDFTALMNGSIETHPGVGARLTYNLNRHIALEGAAYFSLDNCEFCGTGRITQGMFGIKAGQRFKKFGLFVKARPGVINLSKGTFDLVPSGNSKPLLNGSFDEVPFLFVTRSRTDFAVDVGPVLEIYLKKNFFLRVDTGLLIERVGSRTFHSVQVDPATGSFKPFPINIPASNIGRVQLITGVGFRF